MNSDEYEEIRRQHNPITDDRMRNRFKYDEGDELSVEEMSFVENEKGEKFVHSMSAARRQDYNFKEGNKFSYLETFELTKYDATDKLKVQIMFKDEPVFIELERIEN